MLVSGTIVSKDHVLRCTRSTSMCLFILCVIHLGVTHKLYFWRTKTIFSFFLLKNYQFCFAVFCVVAAIYIWKTQEPGATFLMFLTIFFYVLPRRFSFFFILPLIWTRMWFFRWVGSSTALHVRVFFSSLLLNECIYNACIQLSSYFCCR